VQSGTQALELDDGGVDHRRHDPRTAGAQRVADRDRTAVTLTSLDPFHDAKGAALADGAEVSVWLLGSDVASGNARGIDGSQVLVVQRTGTTVTRSTDAAFACDARSPPPA
jgi:hypothetical protein